MKSILYLGNQLKPRGLNPTTIDLLGEKLAQTYNLKLSSKEKNQFLRALDMAWSILRNRNWAEIVIIDTYSTLAFNFAWLNAIICRLLGLPYIVFLHGGDLPSRYKNSRVRSENLLKNAYKIISPSNYLKLRTKEILGLKVEIIPNFIELEMYPYLPKRDISEIRLLWVRAFQDVYNPVMAVEVLKRLNQKGYRATLTMVGGAKDESKAVCEELAKELGLSMFIEFTGRLDKVSWINKSKEYNVFINTSRIDNTPVTLIEAMALGLPIVSTDVGGISYLIEHERNGILVPDNDSYSMMIEIEKLIRNNTLRETLVKNGYQKAKSFDWKVVQKHWKKILN